MPPSLRAGKAWSAIEVKSFAFEVDETAKGLKCCIRERNNRVTSWIRFETLSLQCLLPGVETCVSSARTSDQVTDWEEEGRFYKME